jgi:hypothetical protein
MNYKRNAAGVARHQISFTTTLVEVVEMKHNGKARSELASIKITGDEMNIQMIETQVLKPASFQAEKRTDIKNLTELIESMKTHGFLSIFPIIITKKNMIADGNRRWTAAKEVGIAKVPCVTTNLSLDDAWILSMEGKRTASNGELIIATSNGLKHSPRTHAGKLVIGIQEKYGDDMIKYLAAHGKSNSAITWAEYAARYILVANDKKYITGKIIPWIVELNQQSNVRVFCKNGGDPAKLKQTIEKNEILVFKAV